jgi:hypothetical protein
MPIEAVERVKSPDFYRDKLIGNITAVGRDNYLKGIRRPKKDPIAAGIAAEPKYKDNTQKAINEERRAKHLEFATKELWNEIAEKRADQLPTGVQIRASKVDRFWTGWQPLLKAHVEALDKEPVATFNDRKNKMIKNLEMLVAKKGAWLHKV